MVEVLVYDQKWQFERTISEVDELFDKISKLLEEHKLHVSYMVIDGQEIYDDFKSYIVSQLPEICSIDVKLITLEQFTAELIAASYDYSKQAIDNLPGLSAQFYQSPAKQTWEQFHAFLEGIGWMIRLMDVIAATDSMPGQQSVIAEARNVLDGHMNELLQSMENNDHTTVGDLLQYEVLPLFEQLQQTLGQFANEEGV